MKKRMKRVVIIAVMSVVMLGSTVSYAAGIKVSPGAFCLQNAEIGKNLDLGLDLTITNNSEQDQVFVIKPMKPSEVKKEWLKGYASIPDPSWLRFEKNEAAIQSKGSEKIRMYLNIPDEDKYYNQRWMVFVDVTNKATGEGMMLFKVSVKPNYMIETASMGDVKEKPYGVLGLVPSTITIKEYTPGKKGKGSFKIYNNDDVKHTYILKTHIPQASAEKQDISLTPGFENIKDKKWVKVSKKKISLNPGQVKEVRVSVKVPEKEKTRDQGWESVVMIEPDNGLSGFIRVQIESKE